MPRRRLQGAKAPGRGGWRPIASSMAIRTGRDGVAHVALAHDGARSVGGARRVSRAKERWPHTCAWDGHEMEGMAYIPVSAHERVCWFHHPQFRRWVAEASKRRQEEEARPAA